MRARLGIVMTAVFFTSAAAAGQCPPLLAEATQLVLVVTPSMADSAARLETYRRASKEKPWVRHGKSESAVVGAAGLGWGLPFRGLALDGEPLKAEGDKRAPAGFYKFGPKFGFEASGLSNYLRLETDAHFCVDDVASPNYSRIVSREEAGAGTSGEAMRAIPLYRRGVVIDYPADRAAKGGSCIFLHVWRGPASPTVGCVALREKSVERLQDWIETGAAVIAILPETALGRFEGCLPPAKK